MDTTSATADQGQLALEKSTIRKVAFRVVPFVALMFFINYLDRTAIGFAAPNGMNSDLGLTAAQFGFASGVFFIGYILLEVPSNLALVKFGARRWLARIMVSWGIVAALFAFVQNFEQLAVLRFLLGVAEAGFFPGAILFLSLWVPSQHRGKILALFYIAQPLTTVLGAPIAGLLLQTSGVLGMESWRFMYLALAIPAIVVGIIAWFYLTGPKEAKWLSEAERSWLLTSLDRENDRKVSAETAKLALPPGAKAPGALSALKSGRVWVLAMIYFGFIYGLYALAFFLPTIIAGFQTAAGVKFTLVQQGLITAIPYLPAAIILYFWSRDASRRGLKTWHIAIPALVGGLSIPFALLAGSPVLTIAIITVTASAIFAALPNFWTLPTQFLTTVGAAAGIALINTIGNLAGFSAPFITGALHDWTGNSYVVPLYVVGGFMLLSALLMVLLARSGKRTEHAESTAATSIPIVD